jgi:hypothetical protein
VRQSNAQCQTPYAATRGVNNSSGVWSQFSCDQSGLPRHSAGKSPRRPSYDSPGCGTTYLGTEEGTYAESAPGISKGFTLESPARGDGSSVIEVEPLEPRCGGMGHDGAREQGAGDSEQFKSPPSPTTGDLTA